MIKDKILCTSDILCVYHNTDYTISCHVVICTVFMSIRFSCHNDYVLNAHVRTILYISFRADAPVNLHVNWKRPADFLLPLSMECNLIVLACSTTTALHTHGTLRRMS